MRSLEIINYNNKYHHQFKNINLHWLNKYELYEKADDALLNYPNEFIKNGATIFLAYLDNKIVGTICINPINDNSVEILKFAVLDGYKGLGIGTQILQSALNFCKENGFKTIVLESSSKLQQALRLYEKFGFKHIEIKDTHFITADIKMELKLI